ncbi:hypothetical protein JL722_5997 [Aureococcus anophagefferens]|nr:hypothetical protein JL722_5997 [Aureococcus anophagefferens]
MVKVSPTWVFMVVAFAALVVVHHSNTHVGLLDARERRHAEEVKRLRAMIDHAQRSADAGGAPVAPADAPPPAPAAAGAAARATARRARKAWLAVGLPTVPRADDADYLLQTLASFAAELPRDASDPAHGSVVVFVVNTHGPGHKRFDEASRLYERDAQFRFSAAAEAAPPNEKRDSGSANRPGWRVRKQTRDIVSVLRTAEGAAAYFLFAEDDMKLCGHGLFAAEYVVRRAERAYPNFMACASRNERDFYPRLRHSAFLRLHARAPGAAAPDHLVVEWFAGETESRTYRGDRQHLGFRGTSSTTSARSTLRAQTSGKMPACYEELLAPVVFPVAPTTRSGARTTTSPCGNLRRQR